tara:strand:- start:16971 stop:17204 length:234 start_codon:yes stop_codon:yes gene_type:complete
MKMKYKSPKLIFLESKPKLLSYLNSVKFDLDSIISIEFRESSFVFKSLAFTYVVNTDSEFSFFKSNLIFKEIACEAG